MFQKTVTFKDFNDVEHTEKLYFHLSVPDAMDLQFNPEVEGDMGKWVSDMMKSGENRKVWIFFKLLVVNSYGRRSEDGSKFSKRAEFTQDFLDSNAWEKFFEWLLLDSPDGKNAKLFWDGVMPDRLLKEVQELEAQNEKTGGKKNLKDLSREDLEKLYLEKMASNKVIDGSTTEN